jgi:anti-sigma factor RsiW
MSDILCGYTGDREAALMSYLYDDMAPDERATFDRHLTTCARCRVELNGLGDVRHQLARWSPPDFAAAGEAAALSRRAPLVGLAVQPSIVDRAPLSSGQPAAPRAWWRDMPAWAQVAAAMVVLGVSAGLANLDVHYDARNGLNVRTGWSKPAPAPQTTADAGAVDRAPWRADLSALEQQLRAEIQAATPAAATTTRNASINDIDVVRRFKTLVDDSERRQQSELALRIAELVRDVNVRRDADLRKIDQNLGIMLDRTGVEVMKNRQMIDYYLQRVSQQR